jgi:hypothetical protein
MTIDSSMWYGSFLSSISSVPANFIGSGAIDHFWKKIQNQPLFSFVKVSAFYLKICLWARVKTNFNSLLDFYFWPFLPLVK